MPGHPYPRGLSVSRSHPACGLPRPQDRHPVYMALAARPAWLRRLPSRGLAVSRPFRLPPPSGSRRGRSCARGRGGGEGGRGPRPRWGTDARHASSLRAASRSAPAGVCVFGSSSWRARAWPWLRCVLLSLTPPAWAGPPSLASLASLARVGGPPFSAHLRRPGATIACPARAAAGQQRKEANNPQD